MEQTPNRNSTAAGEDRLAALIRDVVMPDATDLLSPARRRTILSAAVKPRRFAWIQGVSMTTRWSLAAAAAALMLALTPVLFQATGPVPTPTVEAQVIPASVGGLEVFSEGGEVVLRWDSYGEGAYRVIRATDIRNLGSGDTEVIEGNSWKDPHKNGSRVVFYRVEELEG